MNSRLFQGLATRATWARHFLSTSSTLQGIVTRKTAKESIAPKGAPGEKTEWKSTTLKEVQFFTDK